MVYIALIGHFISVVVGGGLVPKLYPSLATQWTVALQAPLFMGFPRQEYWIGLPFPPPGDLSDSGIELSPALACEFFATSATWEFPKRCYVVVKKNIASIPF